MRTLKPEEIKKSELETLKIFRDFCEKNNLRYYLTFGTLLGAVRHKGFIPWDDDIDVFMPREDYNYLIVHFNENRSDNREAVSKEINPSFYLSIAKIIDKSTVVVEKGQTMEIGVWLDIFPLDYLKDNKSLIVKENIFIGILHFLSKYTALKPEKHRSLYKNLIIYVINALRPSYEWFSAIQKKHINRILSKEKSHTYGLTYQNIGYYGVLYAPDTVFEPSVKLEFEGELYNAPRQYKKILICYYGKKYMDLPPINKQVSHHSNICYWKENGSNL